MNKILKKIVSAFGGAILLLTGFSINIILIILSLIAISSFSDPLNSSYWWKNIIDNDYKNIIISIASIIYKEPEEAEKFLVLMKKCSKYVQT